MDGRASAATGAGEHAHRGEQRYKRKRKITATIRGGKQTSAMMKCPCQLGRLVATRLVAASMARAYQNAMSRRRRDAAPTNETS